eukprot:TRINITY_DN4322_c0_g1_i1.p1 TRINITY_DN4322_c0_g1~~TRINITY_DN4322_c0_g1_i1.p1  ORF type:complete len:272 (-),score=70.99 TRINITY_DN4322_c0_g1_i1:712-1527(-)
MRLATARGLLHQTKATRCLLPLSVVSSSSSMQCRIVPAGAARKGGAVSFFSTANNIAAEALKNLPASQVLAHLHSAESGAVLDKDQFAEMCKKHGVVDADALLSSLTASGNVLTFKNNSGKDYILCKPQVVFETVQGLVSEDFEKLEDVKAKVTQIEADIRKIERRSTLRANLVSFGGLSFLVGQFGLYAYLTWGALSWDIMEPITYFTGQFNLIMSYCYFLWAKTEYTLEGQYSRSFESSREKLLRKYGIDLDEFKKLQRRTRALEVLQK